MSLSQLRLVRGRLTPPDPEPGCGGSERPDGSGRVRSLPAGHAFSGGGDWRTDADRRVRERRGGGEEAPISAFAHLRRPPWPAGRSSNGCRDSRFPGWSRCSFIPETRSEPLEVHFVEHSDLGNKNPPRHGRPQCEFPAFGICLAQPSPGCGDLPASEDRASSFPSASFGSERSGSRSKRWPPRQSRETHLVRTARFRPVRIGGRCAGQSIARAVERPDAQNRRRYQR